MTIARRLAEFVQSADSANIDQRVIRDAGLHTLDTLGCIAFSTELDYAQEVVNAVAVDPGPYRLPGVGSGLTLSDAALLAGTLAAGFELDDVGVFVHPGACIVPVAFLAAEWAQRERGQLTSGVELLMSVLVGYEVTVRISEWVGFGPEDEVGWHTPAFHGAIGAAATAARIWRLPKEQTMHAIACAADIAGGGLMQARFGSDIKRLHTGRAAQSGLLSALFAQRGLRGRADVFEDPRWGYYRTIRYRGETESDADLAGGTVLGGLGGSFTSLDKIALKYFPCTAGAQSIIDNVSRTCEELDAGVGDIEEIRIHVSSWFFDQPETLRPAYGVEAVNFSYAYAAAVAAAKRPRRLIQEGSDVRVFVTGLNDPQVRDLQERVRFRPSVEIDAENRYSMDTIAEVHLRDGRSASRRSMYGDTSDSDSNGRIAFAAVNAEGIERKFRNLTEQRISPSAAQAAVKGIQELETATDALNVWRAFTMSTKGDE